LCSTYVLFSPFVRDINVVRFLKTVELIVLRTVCVWPIIVALMTLKTPVEISVMVLKVRFVGKSVRMDVIVEGAVTSARTLKILGATYLY